MPVPCVLVAAAPAPSAPRAGWPQSPRPARPPLASGLALRVGRGVRLADQPPPGSKKTGVIVSSGLPIVV